MAIINFYSSILIVLPSIDMETILEAGNLDLYLINTLINIRIVELEQNTLYKYDYKYKDDSYLYNNFKEYKYVKPEYMDIYFVENKITHKFTYWGYNVIFLFNNKLHKYI